MKTPGGKEGVRSRMYQPRFGRWTVQSSVDVALSWQGLDLDTREMFKMGTHNDVFEDFVVR